MSTVTRKQYKAFLQSDALKMHLQRDDPKKEARKFRRASYLLLVLGLLFGVATSYLSSRIGEQSADPQHASIGYSLTIFSAGLCFMCVCAGIIVLLTCGVWPIYSHLVHRENDIARQLYKMKPLEFYELGKAALLKGAQEVLVSLARDVLVYEQTVTTQALHYQGMLSTVLATEDSREKFQDAYEGLKTAGLIQNVGYGFYYDLALKQLAPQR